MSNHVNVYVPVKSDQSTIAKGSGIVGEPVSDGKINIFFEGNIYGAENLKTFEDRVYMAASRFASCAPTVARGVFDQKDFIEIGVYDFDLKRFLLKDGQQEMFDSWVDETLHSLTLVHPISGESVLILSMYDMESRTKRINRLEVYKEVIAMNPERYGIRFPMFCDYPLGLFANDAYLEGLG